MGNSAVTPTGAGAELDDFNMTYNTGLNVSSEFGGTNFWLVSPYSTNFGSSYDSTLATEINTAYPLKVIANGFSGETNPCSHIVDTNHCAGAATGGFAHNMYDNQQRISDLCSDMTSPNLEGIIAEQLVYAAGPSGTGFAPYQITSFLHLVTTLALGHPSDNCAQVHPIILEVPSQATQIRTDVLALTWIPCYSSGVPTKVVPFLLHVRPG